MGAEIKRRFGTSVAETTAKGDVVELALAKPATIDHVIVMEDVRRGERVRGYVVEGLVGDIWRELCKGVIIGHKRIHRFEPVEVSQVRLRCLDSAAEPIIRKLAVYNVR